jgi:hypothetical protein
MSTGEADFDRLDSSKDSIQVLRNDTTFFQEITTRRVGESRGEGSVRPYVGVDFPMYPDWTHVRLSIATSAKEFDRHFWVGFSILQLPFGVHMEATPIDFHAGVFFSRRDVLTNRGECESSGFTTCRVKVRMLVDGFGVMATVDGGSVIAVLTKAFGLS